MSVAFQRSDYAIAAKLLKTVLLNTNFGSSWTATDIGVHVTLQQL